MTLSEINSYKYSQNNSRFLSASKVCTLHDVYRRLVIGSSVGFLNKVNDFYSFYLTEIYGTRQIVRTIIFII